MTAVTDFPYLPQVVDAANSFWSAAGPYIIQCALWGLAGAAGSGTLLAGAVFGCLAGTGALLFQNYVSNDPFTQCLIWAAGAALGAGKMATTPRAVVSGFGCVGGMLSWGVHRIDPDSPGAQCDAWGATVGFAVLATQALNPNKSQLIRMWPALKAGAAACFAGGFGNILG